ncbi:MAG TPA: hypothetical protein VD995_02865 [Azospirillum sp.]|nr:hypothetical protein [Azospirillum sp.]
MAHQNESTPVVRLDNARTNTSTTVERLMATAGIRIERPLPGRPQPKSRAEG